MKLGKGVGVNGRSWSKEVVWECNQNTLCARMNFSKSKLECYIRIK